MQLKATNDEKEEKEWGDCAKQMSLWRHGVWEGG
jgi:hypothetical protein